MNGGKPDSFDDLDAVTMIRDNRGGWNLFANGADQADDITCLALRLKA